MRYGADRKIRDRKMKRSNQCLMSYFSVPYLSVSPDFQKDIFNAT